MRATFLLVSLLSVNAAELPFTGTWMGIQEDPEHEAV